MAQGAPSVGHGLEGNEAMQGSPCVEANGLLTMEHSTLSKQAHAIFLKLLTLWWLCAPGSEALCGGVLGVQAIPGSGEGGARGTSHGERHDGTAGTEFGWPESTKIASWSVV